MSNPSLSPQSTMMDVGCKWIDSHQQCIIEKMSTKQSTKYYESSGMDNSSNGCDIDDLFDADVVLIGAGNANTGKSTVRYWSYLWQSSANKSIENSVKDLCEFTLEYDGTDKWLLVQASVEIKHALNSSHLKLFEHDNGQLIQATESFAVAAACLFDFIVMFNKWLKAGLGQDGTQSQSTITFGNRCIFLHSEFKNESLRAIRNRAGIFLCCG